MAKDRFEKQLLSAFKKKGIEVSLNKSSAGEYILVCSDEDYPAVEKVVNSDPTIKVLLEGRKDRLLGSDADQLNVSQSTINEAQIATKVFEG